MTLAQLRIAVANLGYDVTTTPAIANGFINDTYRLIYSGQRWPFLEKQDHSLTATVGINTVSLAPLTDLAELDAVRIAIPSDASQFYNITNVEPQAMRDMEHEDHDTAVPRYWSVIANQIHLYPFPDQAYTVYIDYIYMPPDLAADSDVPVLPSEYHDVLVWGAARLFAMRARDIYTTDVMGGMFNERRKAMEESYNLRQRQTSSTVKSSGYWGGGRPVITGQNGW